ncbi:MAG: YqiA/YcfP family alpha/beta fold hydrolase [Candidatus Marinarcus sp.]|uniref:YqiA/YcfP family alpha/beta fold hydrolase n=1 Tax=Candidatus Marinarcus sp. TaxID=3100987 RepID=UPI003AFFA71D
MIIYIHGFGSSGFGGKASLFKEEFQNEIILPSLSYVPTLAIDTLEQLIKLLMRKGEKLFLIGSSLGGYYAIYLANKYSLKAVLINPAITPYDSLNKMGMSTNYFDFSKFEVTPEHMQVLRKFEVQNILKQSNFLLLLQTGDTLLNYEDALDKFPKAKKVVQEGGDHSFVNIETCYKDIRDFFEL